MNNFNLIQWLFTDAQSAGTNGTPEPFHFYLPWMIFNGGTLLLWFYYNVEGRRRFFGRNALNRSLFDKITNQLAVIGLVGWFVLFCRWAMDSSLFSWRFWRMAWLVWVLIVVGRWAVYFMFKYKDELLQYRAYRTYQQYVTPPKPKRAARAGTR